VLSNKPFLYSSDFPHEVTRDSCIEELNELRENEQLTNADKEAVLHKNAQRFYGI
jgi:predicted TIM-barrel fold metal-dependent hydrolase